MVDTDEKKPTLPKNRDPRHGGQRLGARLRGRTTTHAFKKDSEKVLGRVLGKGSQKGFLEGVFQKVPRTPSRRVRPLWRAR